MKHDWDMTTDAALRQYLDSLPATSTAREEPKLQSVCRTLQLVLGEQSCLQHTHTTAWIPSWALAVSNPAARISQIQSLGRWWSWLFDRQIIEHCAKVLCHRLDAVQDAGTNRDTRHYNGKLLKSVLLRQLKNGAQVDIRLSCARFHLHGKVWARARLAGGCVE